MKFCIQDEIMYRPQHLHSLLEWLSYTGNLECLAKYLWSLQEDSFNSESAMSVMNL